jgi:hypothetical protein
MASDGGTTILITMCRNCLVELPYSPLVVRHMEPCGEIDRMRPARRRIRLTAFDNSAARTNAAQANRFVSRRRRSRSPLTFESAKGRTAGSSVLGTAMRCIPEEPEFGDGMLAEKAVWTALKNSLPDECVLAHSVDIRDGRNEYEIDLLVLWPGVGMAAIEVKGGQVSIAGGQWYQSDRNQKRKIQSPVAQSQSSLHALKNWLENQFGSRLSSRCVYMVSLPYTDVSSDWAMAGCPRSLILDQTESRSPAELVRRAIENEGGGASPLAAAFVERIVRQLSGNLNTAVGTSSNPQEDEDAQDHLTERQSVLLQATRSLPRIRFTGGAGSGKTWLAVEKARQLSRQGKRVGLFCYNKGLGQYLQDRVSSWRQAKPAFTGEFHEYVRGLGVPAGSGQDYFDLEMPRLLKELAAAMEPHERLDAVVVDEAQDFAPLWWDARSPARRTPTAVRCTRSWTTGRTSTEDGAARRRTSPMARWPPSCPSTSMKTFGTPARSPKRSSPLRASTSLPAAARACPSGSWIAPPTRHSKSQETA